MIKQIVINYMVTLQPQDLTFSMTEELDIGFTKTAKYHPKLQPLDWENQMKKPNVIGNSLVEKMLQVKARASDPDYYTSYCCILF